MTLFKQFILAAVAEGIYRALRAANNRWGR